MNKKFDRALIAVAAGYIILPVVLFAFGWLKLPIAIVVSAASVFLGIRIVKTIELDDSVSICVNSKFWITALVVIGIWVLFSGIGAFSYQSGDFIVRNPMFRDLILYRWPVSYQMEYEPQAFQELVGGATSAYYVYYFAWWLPAAFVGRILSEINGGFNVAFETVSNMVLFLWTVLGLFLTFYCLVRYFKKYSYWILSTFVLFGGFDAVIYTLKNNKFPYLTHVEWWITQTCDYFQYSANTTQLYWVFNQSVPIWLIIAVLLLMTNKKVMAGWSALSFAYSPFATIGMVPIAIAAVFAKDKDGKRFKWKEILSIENILVSGFMLIVFGTFYMLVAGESRIPMDYSTGFILKVFPEKRTIALYVIFIVVEVGIYLWIMWTDAFKYKFYLVTVLELLLIPLYRGGMNSDFSMRGSIPALFLFMVLCLQYLFEKEKEGNKKAKKIMAIALCVGFLTSVTELQRNVTFTLLCSQEQCMQEMVYSFGVHSEEQLFQYAIDINQYMTFDDEYGDSIFYKYLMRK